jgi:hypothetical protein
MSLHAHRRLPTTQQQRLVDLLRRKPRVGEAAPAERCGRLEERLARLLGRAPRGSHLDPTVVDLEDRNVGAAAAEVTDRHVAATIATREPQTERGRRRPVDEASDAQAGDRAGISSGLTLQVVEGRRHGDDGLVDRLTELLLGCRLEVAEQVSGDLGRRQGLTGHDHAQVAVGRGREPLPRPAAALTLGSGVELAPEQPHDRHDAGPRILEGLPPRGLSHARLAVLAEGHERGRRASAVRVRNHSRRCALHDGDPRVGRAEVDADHSAQTAHLSTHLPPRQSISRTRAVPPLTRTAAWAWSPAR